MIKTAHKILTGVIVALGALHVLMTFHDYDSFSMRALWFASAGVAIILAGFLNIILLRDAGKDGVVRLLCVITNLTFSIMFALALLLLPQPQVFVGAGLFIAATLCSLLSRPRFVSVEEAKARGESRR
jgi:MFS-type transporter involved in bile tolerance (Atg22 family)